VINGVTASRSTALQGTAVAFSSQASDANNDALTYAWVFGDGVTSTAPAPNHVYRTAGTFTVRLTVSDGKASSTQETTVTIKSLTGTWLSGAFPFTYGPSSPTFPSRILLNLTQSPNAVTGSVAFIELPASVDPGSTTITGSVSATPPRFSFTGFWPAPPPISQAAIITLELEPSADVDTLTAVGANLVAPIIFTRQ
jgi:microbial collagenase